MSHCLAVFSRTLAFSMTRRLTYTAPHQGFLLGIISSRMAD